MHKHSPQLHVVAQHWAVDDDTHMLVGSVAGESTLNKDICRFHFRKVMLLVPCVQPEQHWEHFQGTFLSHWRLVCPLMGPREVVPWQVLELSGQ